MVSRVVRLPTGFGLMESRYSRMSSVSYGSAVRDVSPLDPATTADDELPARRVREWLWKAYLHLA